MVFGLSTMASTAAALLLLGSSAHAATATAGVCSILDYKDVAVNATSGATDWGLAIWKAYTDCIVPGNGSTLLIPKGTYDVNALPTFTASKWTLQLEGTVNFLFDPIKNAGKTLFTWNSASNIEFCGKGTIQGNGDLWRPNRDLSKYPRRPRLVRFDNCSRVKMHGLTLLNSPMFHITQNNGNNSEFHHLTIKADNIGATDGFDVSGFNNHVHNVQVENGDECVTVKTPTNYFLAENITCTNSGGNQIGSFGKVGGVVAIQNVHYRNCTMIGSQVGARIKSWPTTDGYIRNVLFEDFKIQDTAYVMEINEFWCDGKDPVKFCPPATGSMRVSNVTFRDFVGTQAAASKRPVVRINCVNATSSGGDSCTDIRVEDAAVTSTTNLPYAFAHACGTGAGLPACC